MFIELKKIVHDCLTEDNGVSYCEAKVAFAISLVSYICMAGWFMYHGDDKTLPQLFGQLGVGLAAVLAGGGALIAGKQATMIKTVNNN